MLYLEDFLWKNLGDIKIYSKTSWPFMRTYSFRNLHFKLHFVLLDLPITAKL